MKPFVVLALSLLAASPAFAQSTTLRYADLDLSSAAGQAELERRIDAVVRQVCRPEAVTGTRIVDHGELARCEQEVRAELASRLPR